MGSGGLDVTGPLTEEDGAAVTLEGGADLDVSRAFSGTLALPNGGAFSIEAPDGLNVGIIRPRHDRRHQDRFGWGTGGRHDRRCVRVLQ